MGETREATNECEDVTRRFEGHPGLSAEWFAFPLAPDVRCSAALFEQRARAPSVAFGATPREVVSPRRFEKKRLFREKARIAESTGSAGRTETVAGTPCVCRSCS